MESFGDQASSAFLTFCCSSDNLLHKQGDWKAIATLSSVSRKLSMMASANSQLDRIWITWETGLWACLWGACGCIK